MSAEATIEGGGASDASNSDGRLCDGNMSSRPANRVVEISEASRPTLDAIAADPSLASDQSPVDSANTPASALRTSMPAALVDVLSSLLADLVLEDLREHPDLRVEPAPRRPGLGR